MDDADEYDDYDDDETWQEECDFSSGNCSCMRQAEEALNELEEKLSTVRRPFRLPQINISCRLQY